MKYTLLLFLLFSYSCSIAQRNHNEKVMMSIENTLWGFNGEYMNLFIGEKTPLNKDFEFNIFSFDPAKIRESHVVPHGKHWFTLELLSDKRCKLTWKTTVADYVIGTATSSYTMVGKWEINNGDLFIHYEYPQPLLSGLRNASDDIHIPSKYTHICRMRYLLDDNILILTPIEIKKIM